MLDMKSPDTLRASIVYNPFDTTDRTDTELVFRSGHSLSSYTEGLPADVEWSVTLNGIVIPKEGMNFTFPKPNDHLIVTPVPEGGGGGDGKSVLALVATVVLSVFAPIAGAKLATAMGMGGSALATSLATAAVSIAGGVLINALIPAPEQAKSEEASYGIDGPKNTSTEGVPFPVLYGEHAFGGNFIDLYTENTTDADGKSIQYLYARTLVSEGPIQSIGQIYINDQPIENYEDVEVDYRLGHRDQSISPWFNETVSLINQNKEMDENWQYYTTSGEVDKIRVDMVAPAGLMYTSKRGKQHSRTVWCDVEYSKVGQNDWKPILSNSKWTQVSANSSATTSSIRVNVEIYALVGLFAGNSTVSAKYRRRGSNDAFQDIEPPKEIRSGDAVFSISGLPEASYEIITFATSNVRGGPVPHNVRVYHKSGQPITITAKTKEPVRRTFKSDQIEEAVYDVRFKRNPPDDSDRVVDTMILSDIGEITVEPISMPYVAWLAVKIKMTGQINSIPTITGEGEGRVLNIYDHNGEIVDVRYSRNPADIALDAYMHTRYGGQLEKERIDFAAFAEWRDYCEEKGLTFDAIFYETSNIDDALKHIYIAGRAQRISSGAKLSVAIDRETSPTMMFSDGNIKSGSMEITYLPFADRINDLEIAFNDRNDRFRRRAVRVTNDQALNRGEPLKSSAIELKGVTDQEAALREGTLRMNYNRLVRRTAKWESPLEAVNCAVGDVVVVQHKMPGWGKGGRVLPASSVSELTLDQDVTFTPGKEYRVLVHQNKKTRLTDISVTSQTGNLISIDKPVDPEWNIGRFTTPNGTDFAILRVVDSNTLLLSKKAADVDLSLLTEGSIHEVDYIDDKRVLNPADAAGESVTTAVIELAEDLEAAPEGYPSFIFGDVQFTKKPFRIKSLTRSSDSEVNLTAVEYVEEVYSDDPQAQAHNYSSLTSAEQVRNLRVEERLVERGASMASYAYAQWEQPENGIYTSAVVQASINGEPYKTVGETTDTQYEFLVEKGDTVLIRVLSVIYSSGATVEPGLATVASLTVRGVTIEPDAPIGWDGSAGVRSVTLFGPAPLIENGFSHFDVYAGDADSLFENATKIGRTESSVFTYTVPAESTHARYWVVEIDTDGNASEPSNHVDITPTAITADEIDGKAITLGKLADAVTQTIDDARAVADQAKADHAALIDGFTKNNLGELEVDYNATQTKAQEAVQAAIDAGTARDGAEAAKTNAEQAQSLAEGAVTDAQAARDGSVSAKNLAETANTNAQSAKNAAETAVTEAEAARDASEGFKTASEAAKTAAETAKTQAQTQATNAANSASASAGSASQAETAETNAGNSASAANAAQVAAQTARDDAQTAASASADSASAASASETATGQDAAATASDRTAAQTARSGAETARDAAVTAKNDAEGAASTATTQAGLAAASANEAGDEATAAANSASTAATKATEASQSASTATTQANTATTKAGEAATSASQAASSKSDAEGSASEAASSATVAATAKEAAVGIAGNWDFSNGTEQWSGTAFSVITGGPTGNSIAVLNTRSSVINWNPMIPYDPAKTYRITLRVRGTGADGPSRLYAGLAAYELDGTSQAGQSGVGSWHWGIAAQQIPNDGEWVEYQTDFTGTDSGANSLLPDTAFVRPILLANHANDGDHVTEVDYFGIEDVTQEVAAQGHATAAATSASTASTKATEAAQSASTATTQANTATTKAGEAATSASQAASSKTDAAGSASTAATHASNAANSANDAGDEADAAATSASTASTKATEAAQSASSANTSKNTATTKAGEASTSAGQAASSAADAEGFKNEAASFSEVAASSSRSAEIVSREDMGFKHGRAWMMAFPNFHPSNTDTIPSPAVRPSSEAKLSGNVMSSLDGGDVVSWREVIPVDTSRVYRYRTRYRCVELNGDDYAGALIGFESYDENGSAIRFDPPGSTRAYIGATNLTPAHGWVEIDELITGENPDTLNPGTANIFRHGTKYIQPYGNINRYAPNAVTEIDYITWEDVTSEYEAEQAANAAATSASTASTKATEAAQSASSASSSANTASTKAGEASASASQAASSKNSAASSASTAATQASNAANSANTAGGHATAAANSASTASTKATEAGNSASSASASAVTATSARDIAVTLSSDPYFSGDASISPFVAYPTTENPPDYTYWDTSALYYEAGTDDEVGGKDVVAKAYHALYLRQAHVIEDGRTYRMTFRVKVASNPDNKRLYLGLYPLNSDFSTSRNASNVNANWYGAGSYITEDADFVEYTREFTKADLSSYSSTKYVRLLVLSSYSGASAAHEVRFSKISFEDITDVKAAEDAAGAAASSASAAATSASTATTKASEAGSSASSASTSANTASTKASQASTSATTATNAANTATGASATAVSARDTTVSVSNELKLLADMQFETHWQRGGEYWVLSYQQSKAALANAGSVAGGAYGPLIEVSDIGTVFHLDSSGPRVISERGLRPFVEGQRLRFRMKLRATTGNPKTRLWLVGVTSSGVYSGYEEVYGRSIATSEGWTTFECEFEPVYQRSSNSSSFGASTEWRLMLGFGYNAGGLTEIASIDIQDVSKSAAVQTLESAVVDLEGNAAAALSFRTIAGTAGAELELAAFDDMTGAASLARISADNVLIEGTVTIDHLDANVLNADNITAGKMSVARLEVDEIMSIDATTAGFAMNKFSPYDLNTDGIYMGRTDEGGSTGFGFAMSYDNGTSTESIQATSQTGLKINNAKFFRDLSPVPSPIDVTTSQTVTIPAGSDFLNLKLIGGGGGGHNGDGTGNGFNGGATTVVLKNGTTTIKTWTATGGAGGNGKTSTNNGSAGQSSIWGKGGAGGAGGNGTVFIPEQPGGHATGYGAGGGGGGGTNDGGKGGLAGQLISVSDYDISGLSNPSLVITVGAKGNYANGSERGGNGSPGKVEYTTRGDLAFRADVIPLTPTATGTMLCQGPFPNLGAGYWVLSRNVSGNMDFGDVEINDSGKTIRMHETNAMSFISSKTPVILNTPYPNKTINYQFFKMGT